MKLIRHSINDLLNNHKIVLIAISFILGIYLNEFSNTTWILVAITGLMGGGLYLYISGI